MSKVEGTGGSREISHNRQLKKGEQKSTSTLFNYGEEQSGQRSHTVSKGETAFAITRKYNITIYQLAEANGWQVTKKNGTVILKKNGKPVSMQEGMKINIPDISTNNKPVPEQTNKNDNGTYTVKASDNPMSIADLNGISIRQLANANGWEIDTRGEKIRVLKNGKEVILQKGEQLQLPPSVTSNLEGITTLSDVKKATGMSDRFIDLITGFEGNPANDFQPYTEAYPDSNGVWTIGYGYTKGINAKSQMSKAAANTQLAKDYLQIKEDIRLELGNEVFNKIPQPLLDGVIDLVYNKGFEALNKKAFSDAISSNNIPKAFEQLIFTKSIKTGQDMNGLYKRSLARLAMVYKSFDTDTQQQLKPVIDKFYKTCKDKINLSELNIWWNENSSKSETNSSKSQYIVQEGDSGLIAIARKLGINYDELRILNRHLEPDLIIRPGDVLNLPLKGNTTVSPPNNKLLSEEIQNIKKLDLSKEERLKKTEEIFDKFAKYYNIPKEAVEIFKKDARDEYNSWFWVDTDNMRAMARVLDAQNPEDLHKAIKTAIDESSEAKKFTGLVLNKKINESNIRKLIEHSGGTEKFVKMIKKAGGFDVLRHSLNSLINKDENNTEILNRFEQAVKDEKYSDIIKVFNNVLADTPEKISKELARTLDKDDDLNSLLYKYQIQRVKGSNVLEVLRSNDIIAGICEAENDRATCKAEIMKLFNLLDKNYTLDTKKKEEFLQLVNKEFRERVVWNPTTWWIGTSKISESFKELISGKIKGRNAATEVYRALNLPVGTKQLDKLTDENGNIIPFVETYAPTGNGKLSGKRIVVNAGHGGYGNGENGKEPLFDPGAINNETGVDEWLLNRFMAKQLIENLRSLGAEVVLTAGQINTVSYNDFGGDMKISLHADAHDGTSGPRLYAFDKDKEDKKLAKKILYEFVNSENAINVKDLRRKEITFNLDMKTNDENIDSMQAKIVDNSHWQILKKDKKNAADEPAILVEYCNITKNKEVEDIVMGNLGKDIINSIVNGVVKYYDDEIRLASLE